MKEAVEGFQTEIMLVFGSISHSLLCVSVAILILVIYLYRRRRVFAELTRSLFTHRLLKSLLFFRFFHIADYFRGTVLDSQIEYIDLEFIMYSYKAGSVYCRDEASFLSNSIRLYIYCLGCYLCLTSRKKITDAAQSPKRCLALVLKANPKEREVMKSRLDSRWWMGSSIWLPDVTLAFFFYYVGVLSRRFDWQRPSSNPISVGQRDSRTGTNLSLTLSLLNFQKTMDHRWLKSRFNWDSYTDVRTGVK